MSAGMNTAPVDHSAVRGPARDHAARADEMMKRIQEGKDPYGRDAPQPAQEGAQPAQEAGGEPPAAQEPPKQEQQPSPGQEPPKQDDGKPKDFEQMYRSLKGSFDGLRTRFDTLSSENEQLRRTITQLEAQGKTPPPSPAARGDITDEERAEYGPEFFDMLERYTAPLRAELQDARQQLDGVKTTTVQSAREKMHEALDKDVSNWRDINVDDEFKVWLLALDEASGQPRQNLLVEAYQRNEAARVAYFFRKFLSEVRGEVPQSPKGSDTRSQGRAAAPEGQGLERFAGTGKGRTTGAPEGGGDKPTFTTSEIAKFYADKRTGKFRGKEAEADRIEREIFAAQGDNRIRAG
jgi:hypothetical protein